MHEFNELMKMHRVHKPDMKEEEDILKKKQWRSIKLWILKVLYLMFKIIS